MHELGLHRLRSLIGVSRVTEIGHRGESTILVGTAWLGPAHNLRYKGVPSNGSATFRMGARALAFTQKPATFRDLYSGCLTMRGFVAVLTFSVFLVQPALAQGIKDPPNYPLPNAQNPRKTQAIQDPSRLNPIRSAPTGSLPAGIAVQGGKLVAVPRY